MLVYLIPSRHSTLEVCLIMSKMQFIKSCEKSAWVYIKIRRSSNFTLSYFFNFLFVLLFFFQYHITSQSFRMENFLASWQRTIVTPMYNNQFFSLILPAVLLSYSYGYFRYLHASLKKK